MRFIKPLILAGAISLILPSCFLFRSKHESCPAYGQGIKNQNENKADIKLEKNELSEKA